MKLKDLVYVADSTIHGRGAFAQQTINKNQYIGRYSGPRAKRNGKYVLWITEEDGTEYGIRGQNRLRYLNHSFKPNAYFEGEDLYALKRIRAGEEITFDYGWDKDDV